MKKKKVYYAHTLSLYNTPAEARDVALLMEMGFEVINPNCLEISKQCEDLKTVKDSEHYERLFVKIFKPYIKRADFVIFKGLPDCSIPAGVAKELQLARIMKKGILELPVGIIRRSLTPEETREQLRDCGQR